MYLYEIYGTRVGSISDQNIQLYNCPAAMTHTGNVVSYMNLPSYFQRLENWTNTSKIAKNINIRPEKYFKILYHCS